MFNRKFNKAEKTRSYANDLVGCLGKLPLHMEFIKHGLTRPELASLDQWYQSAYAVASRHFTHNSKQQFSIMPNYHFIYSMGYEKEPMLGTLISSQDKSGRAYPFVTFRLLENPVAKEFLSITPELYANYYTACQQLLSMNWQSGELPDLYASVNQLNQTDTTIKRRQALEMVVAMLNRMLFAELWQQIKIGYPDLQLGRLLSALKQTLTIVKQQLVGNTHLGLRLPIANGYIQQASVVFWLQLLDSMLGQHSYPAHYFWSQANDNFAANLTVYFKPMPPTTFIQLVDPLAVDDSLFDMVKLAQLNNSDGDFAAEQLMHQPLIKVLETISQN